MGSFKRPPLGFDILENCFYSSRGGEKIEILSWEFMFISAIFLYKIERKEIQ